MKKLNNKQKGFTLVELIITLMVIIVLMSVSVPFYKSYTENFKIAEGYALLATIRSAQEQYYSEYGTFLQDYNSSAGGYNVFTSKETVLDINALTNKYFRSFSVSRWAFGGSRSNNFFSEVKGNLGNGLTKNLVMKYDIVDGVTIYEVGF